MDQPIELVKKPERQAFSASRAEVAAQKKNLDAFDGGKRVVAKPRRRGRRGTVVRYQDCRFHAMRAQFPLQSREQNRKRFPIIVQGHQNDELVIISSQICHCAGFGSFTQRSWPFRKPAELLCSAFSFAGRDQFSLFSNRNMRLDYHKIHAFCFNLSGLIPPRLPAGSPAISLKLSYERPRPPPQAFLRYF